MTGILKHGIGYDLIVIRHGIRLHLAIKCQTCQMVSYHFKDISERYCGHCKVFHEDQSASQQV